MVFGSARGRPKHPPHLTNVNFARTPEGRPCGLLSRDDLQRPLGLAEQQSAGVLVPAVRNAIRPRYMLSQYIVDKYIDHLYNRWQLVNVNLR